MFRSFLTTGITLAAVSLHHDAVTLPAFATTAAPDVRALLDAARGAPTPLCRLAASAIGDGGNWGWAGAPMHPLGADPTERRRIPLTAAEIALAVDGIAQSDPCVREIAVQLLAREESPSVVAGLLRQLAATDSTTRMVAALGLGLITPEGAVEPLLRALADRATGPRANAAWALGRLDDGRALRSLIGALDDAQPMVRAAAAGSLGQLDSTAAVTALLRRLRVDTEPAVRRTAAWALAQLDAESAAGGLAQALAGDRDATVREMSAWALGDLGRSTSSSPLLDALRGDTDASVRETAAWALGQRNDKTIGDALGQLLAGERDPRTRGTIAWTLGSINLRKAPRGLIAALTDSTPDVRLKAAWALSEIGDSSALPALRTALRQPASKELRRAQLRAVMHAGEDPERLIALLESSDAQVRQAITRALAGRNHPDPWPWPAPRPRPFP